MYRWLRRLWIIGVLLIAGCGSLKLFIGNVGQLMRPSNSRVTTPTYDGVIFTMDNAADSGINVLFNEPIERYWTPTAQDVDDLETRLIPYLEQAIPASDHRHGFWESLPGYKRQYIGAFRATDPYLWANFFCVDDFDDWQSRLIFVDDGGECFFNVWYNPTTHEFSDLQINGYA